MRRVSSLDNGTTLQQAGQGDAFVFSPLDNSGLINAIYANKADETRRAKAKAERDAQLADELKYNHKAIFSPYAKEHEQKALDLLKLRSKILSQGSYDPTHPDRLAYEKAKNDLEQNVSKAKEVQDLYPSTISMIDKDPFLHRDQTVSQVNDVLHDENGTSRLPISAVKSSDLQGPLKNPDNLNLTYASQNFAKTLPEQVKSYISQQRSALGERFDENIVKSKFYKYDAAGNQIKDKSGNPVINITPETKSAFYQSHPLIEPRIKAELQKPENQGLTEDDLVAKLISPYAYENRNTNVGGTTKWNTDGDGKKKGFVMQPAVITQTSANDVTHNAPGVVLSKNDKPLDIPIAANQIYNFGTGLIEQKNTARVPVKVSGLGYSIATKDKGKLIAFDSPEDMVNFINTTPRAELDKYELNQYLFGAIEEKTNREGDTAGNEDANETNKSVAIKYNPRGVEAGYIEGASGGAFKKRELSPGEKAVTEAWEKRMKGAAPAKSANTFSKDEDIDPSKLVKGEKYIIDGKSYTWDGKNLR